MTDEINDRLHSLYNEIDERDRVIKQLENENRQIRNDLAMSRDSDSRGRTGWRLAKEACESSQRLIDVLQKELAERSEHEQEAGRHQERGGVDAEAGTGSAA